MPSNQTDTSLFAQIYNGLLQALGQDLTLQINVTPQTFNWPVAPLGSVDPTAYQFVSTMPKYSQLGTFAPNDAKFFDSYQQVLSHIKFEVSPDKQASLDSLRNQLTSAQNEVTAKDNQINLAYQTAKQSGGVVFAAQYPDVLSWIQNDPAGKSLIKQKSDLQAAVDKIANLYADMLGSCGPDLYRNALAACKKPTTDPTGPVQPGWCRVNDASGVPQWQPAFIIGGNSNDWRNALTKGTQGQFTINITSSQSTTKFSNQWAGGNASYGCPFWGVYANGGWQEMNLSQDDNSVACTISCASSTLVNVSPDVWYDGGLMRNLAQGASQGFVLTDGYSVSGPKPQVFGSDGILPDRIAQILVVYKPTFKLTMSNSTYTKYSKTIQAGGGIRIGPFCFGGNGGSQKQYTMSTNGSNSFEGGSTSSDPLILGVVVSFPGTA